MPEHHDHDQDHFASAWGPGPRRRRGDATAGPAKWHPGGPPWAGGPWGGGGPWAGGGGRRRKGDIRAALLTTLLQEGPGHGYELISRLESRSGGLWRPSPGSVYPTLQMLEEQGLVAGRDEDGKRVFELTDQGRTAAEATAGRRSWEAGEASPRRDLRQAMGTVMLAARQVGVAGDDSQVEAALAVLAEARQKLYRLLAEE
jgi:DNA-binding PadR family transcriptional regulator